MSLRSDERQNFQLKLDFFSAPKGEAPKAAKEAAESPLAKHGPESPAGTNRLMEEVCERENLKEALRQVKANKGSPGVDGMTVGGIKDYLKQHWPAIREQLLNGTYPHEKFDFLGYTFRPRRSKNRKGKFFINFSPTVSAKAVKAIREEIRSWDLHLRSDKRIEDLSRMFNPKIRGWLQYYGRFYRSALYPPLRQLDRSLAHWAERKYKKLRGHLRRATHWVARISRRDPQLWAHWQMGVRCGSMVGAV